jgi:hypothetical protein
MGGGVLGLDVDGIFGAEVGALIVFVVHIKLCDGEVFVDAFVVGLNSFDLGEFAMNGSAFGGIGRIARGGGVASVGVGIVARGTGAGAAAGVVAGKFGRGLRGEWMLGRGVGRSGGRGTGRVGIGRVGRSGRVRGVGRTFWFAGFAGEWELLGRGGWFPGGWDWRGTGFCCLGCLIGGLSGCLGRSWTGCRGWALRWRSLGEAGGREEEGDLERSGYGISCHRVYVFRVLV